MATAPQVPRCTCARVQATTSTISAARQAMVSFSEVSASKSARSAWRISVRGVKAEALQEGDEGGAVGADGLGVAGHLDEPGVALGEGEPGHHPAPLLPVAGEVVDRERAGPGLHHLARRAQGRLVEGREADLAAP